MSRDKEINIDIVLVPGFYCREKYILMDDNTHEPLLVVCTKKEATRIASYILTNNESLYLTKYFNEPQIKRIKSIAKRVREELEYGKTHKIKED